MGTISLKIGEGTARFKRPTLCSLAANLLMVFSIIITNLFTLYAFNSSPQNQLQDINSSNNNNGLIHNNITLISHHGSLILREIDSSQKKLAKMKKDLLGYEKIDISKPNIASELKLYLQHRIHPKDSRTGITEIVASSANACFGDGDKHCFAIHSMTHLTTINTKAR